MKPRFTVLCLLTLSLAATVLSAGCKAKEPVVDVAGLVQKVKTGDTDAKVNALVELAKAGPKSASAMNDLIPVVKDKDPLVRRLAVYALGQIGPQASAALPTIREALNDPDEQVVKDAVNAIRFIDANAPKGAQMQNVMTPK